MDEKEYAIEHNGEFVRDDDLILRIPVQGDMDCMFQIEQLENDNMYNRYEAEEDRELWKNLHYALYTNAGQEVFYLSIIDRKSKTFLGRLLTQDYKSIAPEIGIYLLEEHQGKGIAKKAIQAYISKAKELREIPYFSARIDMENVHSQKMMEKLNSENCMTIRDTYCYKVFS